MTVRQAVYADVDQVLRMAAAFIASSAYADQVVFNEPYLRGLVPWLIDEQLLLVLEHEGALVGMLAMATVPQLLSGDLTCSEIAWWVNPQHRGSIGAVRLWIRGERWAAARGARWVQMIAPPDATDVHEFYRRRGYRPLETVWQAGIPR